MNCVRGLGVCVCFARSNRVLFLTKLKRGKEINRRRLGTAEHQNNGLKNGNHSVMYFGCCRGAG